MWDTILLCILGATPILLVIGDKLFCSNGIYIDLRGAERELYSKK